jgi:hypothetical protein
VDIPALFNKKDEKSDEATNQPMGVLGDPLATAPADDAATASTAADDQTSDDQSKPIVLDGQILVPNQTIDTNDRSKVGDLKDLEKPKRESINADVANFLGVPTPPQPEKSADDEPAAPATEPDLATELPAPVSMPEPEDPEKTAFIKTYTQEFDDALRRATDAAQKILDAIDTAVHEHSSDIAIPEEAGEFMDQKLEDGKVQKFEDARAIVREVMTRAAEAKEQSAQAAAEAAKVYDEVQQFKKETKEQIAELVAEDE